MINIIITDAETEATLLPELCRHNVMSHVNGV